MHLPPLPLQVAKAPASANVVLEYCINAGGPEQVLGAQVPAAVQQSVLDMDITNEQDYGMTL